MTDRTGKTFYSVTKKHRGPTYFKHLYMKKQFSVNLPQNEEILHRKACVEEVESYTLLKVNTTLCVNTRHRKHKAAILQGYQNHAKPTRQSKQDLSDLYQNKDLL